MKNMQILLLAGALAVGIATSASAITISSDMTVDVTPNVNNAFQIVFDWPDTPNETLETINIGFDFELTIDSVSGGNGALGYFVEDFNANRITDSTSTTCSGFGSAQQCNLIFNGTRLPFTLANNLSAGEYTFGVFGATVPNAGSITFGITKVSEVPLPAGGLLLLTALGGVAAMRRRKS